MAVLGLDRGDPPHIRAVPYLRVHQDGWQACEQDQGYEEDKTHLFKFFDKKGYIMMAYDGRRYRLARIGRRARVVHRVLLYGVGRCVGGCGRQLHTALLQKLEAACPAMPGTYTKHHKE